MTQRGEPLPVVVLGSTDFASNVPLGDWQLARAFAANGHPVLWIDPARSLVRPHRRRRRHTECHIEIRSTYGISGTRPWLLEGTQRALLTGRVNRLVESRGWTDPLVVIATPARGTVEGLRRHRLVYWQKDRQWAFSRYQGHPWYRHTHEALLRQADVVTGVSESIVRDNRALDITSNLLVNGVEIEHWQARQREPADLADIPHPRVVFSGAYGWRIDRELMTALVGKLPHVSFVLLGETVDPPSAPNVHPLGSRSYFELPSYLQHCDVGIVPYATSEFNEASAPLKLLEYLATDLPVVAAGIGVPDLAGVTLAPDLSGWTGALEAAIDASAGFRSAPLDQHSWRNRAAQLIELAR